MARGFTLIELLLSMTLVVVICGTIAMLARPVRDTVERSAGHEEMTLAARAALEQLMADLQAAGAGPAIVAGPRLGELVRVVTPLAQLEEETPVSEGTAIRIVTVPRGAPQAALRPPMAAGDTALRVDSTRCTALSASCGFSEGRLALVLDRTRAAFVTVGGTAGDVLSVTPPVAFAPDATAHIAAAERVTYGLRVDADGTSTLVRLSTGGAEQPLLRHVVAFAVAMPSPARVLLQVRVAAAAASLRGSADGWFVKSGSTGVAARWVPDLELRSAVALRNVAP